MNRIGRVNYLIYLSHCLSAWGDRMWDFAVGLYMVILYPESLLLAAILGFATSVAVITFGSTLGSWIDKTNRIRSATLSIIIQNAAVALGAIILSLTFAYQDEVQLAWNGNLRILIYILLITSSVIAKIASVASDIAIERDWIVVLTNGDETSLATMNSVMRTIDLTTKILAPVAIGALISYWSQMSGAIFIAGWNVVSCFAEIYLLHLIYKWMPQLGVKNSSQESHGKNPFKECWDGWCQYFRHSVLLAGLAFSCMFMTVLGFDQITIGYIYSQGMGESWLGFLTALAAIAGICGSVVYPFFRKCMGKHATAILGYILNTSCQLLCVVSIFMIGSPFEPSAILNPFGLDNNTSSSGHETLPIHQLWEQRQNVFYFVAGIILARFGLWVADLSTAQLFQDNVEESKRGVINGVQNSMNQVMDLLKFLLVIILPSPQTFGYLVFATWAFSCISCVLQIIFSFTPHPKFDRRKRSSAEFVKDDHPTPSSSTSVNEQTPLLMLK